MRRVDHVYRGARGLRREVLSVGGSLLNLFMDIMEELVAFHPISPILLDTARHLDTWLEDDTAIPNLQGIRTHFEIASKSVIEHGPDAAFVEMLRYAVATGGPDDRSDYPPGFDHVPFMRLLDTEGDPIVLSDGPLTMGKIRTRIAILAHKQEAA